MSHDPIVLDGSRGGGGGLILRNAMSCATVLQKDVYIHNIGSGSDGQRKGMRAQHLVAMQLCIRMKGHGTLHHAQLQSTKILYKSSTEIVSSNNLLKQDIWLRGDTGTAGSIVLILQAALFCGLFRPDNVRTSLRLVGGTNSTLGPQYEYWQYIFWPTLAEQCGLNPQDQVKSQVIHRGYFPEGNGQVNVRIQRLTKALQPIQLNKDQGTIASFFIRSFHCNKPEHSANRMAQGAEEVLRDKYPAVTNIESNIAKDASVLGSGLGIFVMATTTTGCRFAESALITTSCNNDTRTIGRNVALKLVQTIKNGGCVDDWLQDQLIQYMALADGLSEMRTGSLTLHTPKASDLDRFHTDRGYV